MRETSKAVPRRTNNDYLVQSVLVGKALDIGGGDDPISPIIHAGLTHVTCLDQYSPTMWNRMPKVPRVSRVQGNANNPRVTLPSESYDLVYSSNCLEHLENPHGALKNWWDMVMIGGHMLFTVPDEILYEHGFWPPRYNDDHKHTFRIRGTEPATPVSININALVESLSNCEALYIQRVDTNYDYGLPPEIDQTLGDAEAFIEVLCKKMAWIKTR